MMEIHYIILPVYKKCHHEAHDELPLLRTSLASVTHGVEFETLHLSDPLFWLVSTKSIG